MAALKIREAIEHFSFKRKVTLSFGIASFAENLTQHDLVLNTDKALYHAKHEGKNCIRVFEEIQIIKTF